MQLSGVLWARPLSPSPPTPSAPGLWPRGSPGLGVAPRWLFHQDAPPPALWMVERLGGAGPGQAAWVAGLPGAQPGAPPSSSAFVRATPTPSEQEPAGTEATPASRLPPPREPSACCPCPRRRALSTLGPPVTWAAPPGNPVSLLSTTLLGWRRTPPWTLQDSLLSSPLVSQWAESVGLDGHRHSRPAQHRHLAPGGHFGSWSCSSAELQSLTPQPSETVP